MNKISLTVARHYINHRLAGFYAWRAQAPIAHPSLMCVYANSQWWLIENGEFQVTDKGIVEMPTHPNGWMRLHEITVDDQHPIVRELRADQENDRGPDLPFPVSLVVHSMENNDP